MIDKLKKVLKGFENKNIVIIGDVMLDTYIHGSVDRISVEAPIMIHSSNGTNNTTYGIGGAGNVASNISSLGGKAYIFSFIGNDEEGKILKNLFEEKNIEHFLDESRQTSNKTRFLVENWRQVFRHDREDLSEKIFSNNLKSNLLEKVNKADIIVISDYAKGTITKDLIDLLSEYRDKIIVDPKPKNKLLYSQSYLIKPNEKEIIGMYNSNNVEEAIRKLKKESNSNIILTRGKDGMMILTRDSDEIKSIPTYAKEVFNPSGAGDTVTATLALALASGASFEEAAVLANHAAGISVEKRDVYSVRFSELESKIIKEERKIVNLDELKIIVKDYRERGGKIVWTNGCFDLIHSGHVKYLKEAKKYGDILIVGLDSDESVRKLKGNDRPLNNENDRAEILSSLEPVDYVTIFQAGEDKRYVSELKPEIFAKGEDYTLEYLNSYIGNIINSYGGEIKLIPYIKGKSTTNLIERIKNNK